MSRHTRQKPLVLPAELSQLQDLEGYVKYPGDYPCTKIQMDYQRTGSVKAEPFLLKPEKVRAYPVASPANTDVPEGTEVPQKGESSQESEPLESIESIPENKEVLV